MYGVDEIITEEIFIYATPSYASNDSTTEEQIYQTSCVDEDDDDTTYTEPPTEIEKIYETFGGKIFCSENIRYLRELAAS